MSARFSDTVEYENGDSGALTEEQANGHTNSLESTKHRLSFASRRLDRGDKGYLDDIEKCARKYDVDGDGQFSIDEVTKIVEDLETQRHKKHVVKRKMSGILGFSLVLLVCVFGLMMSTLILSRKVNVNDSTNELVSDKTGHTLMTMKKGVQISVTEEEPGETESTRKRSLDEESRILLRAGIVGSFKTADKRDFENAFDAFESDRSTAVDLSFEDSDSNTQHYKLLDAYASKVTLGDGTERYRGLRDDDSSTSNPIFYRFDCGSPGNLARCIVYNETAPVPIVGGVTQNEAVIGFQTGYNGTVTIRYSDSQSFATSLVSSSVYVDDTTDHTGSIKLTGLAIETRYYYEIQVDGWAAPHSDDYPQTFRTFPPKENTVIFSVFADSANANLDRVPKAYASAESHTYADDHYFAMQIGDFDHADPPTTDFTAMLDDLRKKHRDLRDPDKIHGSGFVKDILTRRPLVHVWDDHDYCGNDADGTCTHKSAALQAYKEFYPGYDLADPSQGIWHNFTAGDAEFFMLDTRYQRTPDTDPDDSNKTILGTAQKDWLKQGLLDSQSTWKFVVSTITANVDARPTNIDHWGSFVTEANEMKDFLKEKGLDGSTIMISGDLHTGGAVDDGCNNRWGIVELGVPHTNLGNGNDQEIGTWSRGSTLGTEDANDSTYGAGGYGIVKITQTYVTLEAMDAGGHSRHNITLPLTRGACTTRAPTASPAPTNQGFLECSDDVKRFGSLDALTKGTCANTTKGENYTHPYPAEGGGTLSKSFEVYECPTLSKRILRSNAIPDTYVKFENRNQMCERKFHVELPLNPSIGTRSETNFFQGIAKNGVPIFNALEAGSSNAVEPDGRIQDADEWYGHPTARDIWHYHSPYIGRDNFTDMPGPDDFLGWAMDGYKIYGPVADADLGSLDECNFNGTVYHVRTEQQVDESLDYCKADGNPAVNWNYILGCYVGDLSNSAVKDADVETVPAECQQVTPNIF